MVNKVVGNKNNVINTFITPDACFKMMHFRTYVSSSGYLCLEAIKILKLQYKDK